MHDLPRAERKQARESRSATAGTSRGFLWAFEGVRGIAALGVFLYHFHHVDAFDQLARHPRLLFTEGWLFVDLFFFLSGWVMVHTYADRLEPGDWTSLRSFFVARFARLYPLHLVTSLLWGTWLIARSDPTIGQVMTSAVSQLSLTFTWGPLGTWGAGSPTNPLEYLPPAWSISAEAAAYAVFPLLLVLSGQGRRLGTAVSLVAAGLAGYLLHYVSFGTFHVLGSSAALRGISGFAIGMGLRTISTRLESSSTVTWLLQGAVLTALFWAPLVPAPETVLLPAGVLLVYSVHNGKGPLGAILQREPFVFLGKVSYSLYMWHWFAIATLETLFAESDLSLASEVLWASTAALGVGLVAWFSYSFLEAPARKRLRSHLSSASSAAKSNGSAV